MILLRKIRKLSQLSWGDLHLFLITFVLLGTIRLGLWLLPFHTLLKILDKASKSDFPLPTPDSSNSSLVLAKIIWSVNTATRNMPGGAKCLARALTTKFLMTRYGHLSQLCIGVAKKDKETLEAHA